MMEYDDSNEEDCNGRGGVVAAISFDCADGNRRTDGTVAVGPRSHRHRPSTSTRGNATSTSLAPPRPCPPLAGCSAIYESPDISINPSTSNDIGWTVGLGGVRVSQRGKLQRRWKRSRPLAPSVESWHRLDLALRVPTAPNHSFDVEQCRMDGRSWWSGIPFDETHPSSVMNDLFVARLGVEGTRGRGMR